MAAPQEEYLGQYYQLCTELFFFKVPRPKNVKFDVCLKSTANTDSAKKMVELMNTHRFAFVSSLDKVRSFNGIPDAVVVEEAIANTRTYFAVLWRFIQIFEREDQGTVMLDKQWIFEWLGSISSDTEFFRSGNYYFDLLMVLWTWGILLQNLAFARLKMNTINFLQVAGKNLLQAASIVNFMIEKISSKSFTSGPNGSFALKQTSPVPPNPLEVNVGVLTALSSLFKANAQAMATLSSIHANKGSGTLKCRLCLAVVKEAKLALNGFQEAPKVHTAYSITWNTNIDMLYTHAANLFELYSALAYYHLALDAKEETKTGISCGFCLAAREHLRFQTHEERYSRHEKGFPPTSSNGVKKNERYHSTVVVPGLKHLSNLVEQTYKDVDQDNRFIHFQSVPPFENLPPLPTEAVIMKPTNLDLEEALDYPDGLPAVASVYFHPLIAPKKNTGFFASFFGTAETVPTKSPTPEPTPEPTTQTSLPDRGSPTLITGQTTVPAPLPPPPQHGIPLPGLAEGTTIPGDEALAQALQAKYNAEFAVLNTVPNGNTNAPS